VSDTTTTFLIVAVAVAVFVWDRLPVGIVTVGTALLLWATGVLDYEQTFAGFGDPTVIFIASLFVVSEGLDAAGVTSWAGQELISRIGLLCELRHHLWEPRGGSRPALLPLPLRFGGAAGWGGQCVNLPFSLAQREAGGKAGLVR